MSGSESPTKSGDDPISQRAARDVRSPRRSDREPALRLAVVDQDGRPDRATIHPPGLTGTARLETWLSVDLSVVVELSAWR
ncbi:DUF7511 domain-containing protein [Halobellus marinus]|uniref:DUF7511 domain-containing protein n=1 Tax=Halobellus TaxID=1073986 RepID=UPI0028AA710B|nr:hypothetical protein [Halobellus sp. DFY28]